MVRYRRACYAVRKTDPPEAELGRVWEIANIFDFIQAPVKLMFSNILVRL